MVYVDEAEWRWRGMLWCHMTADTIEELHGMAGRIGLKREWYQGPPKTRYPHYDMIASRRLKAVKLGALPVDKRVLVEKSKSLMEKMTIFVFGSNLAGIHGTGSALEAKLKHRARQGVGIGPTGRAYAIPTRSEKYVTLPLRVIAKHVLDFKRYAAENPDLVFNVVKVGCGRAGLNESTMQAMFHDAPPNCRLPPGWRD